MNEKKTPVETVDKNLEMILAEIVSAITPPSLGKALSDHLRSKLTELKDKGLMGSKLEEVLRKVASTLNDKWTAAEAKKLLDHISEQFIANAAIDLVALTRWMSHHQNNSKAVADCMDANPPDEIQVLRVLSEAGSQKRVFLATWKLTQKEVVLKRAVGSKDITARELKAHPLSIRHANIIETHFLKNTLGETYLVEERLSDVFTDYSVIHDTSVLANVLYDMAKALKYLHVDLKLVHGDIKPDNIGRRGRDYVLLDFGICRPVGEFTSETTGTGSLRTRAPELLLADSYKDIDAKRTDIWALGATLYKFYTGKFPLLNHNEVVPKDEVGRKELETKLRQRVSDEWEQRVDLKLLENNVVAHLVEKCLRKVPAERVTVDDLIEEARKELGPYLRISDNGNQSFSPLEEWEQIRSHLCSAETIQLLPISQKNILSKRLTELLDIANISSQEPGMKEGIQGFLAELR